ncbi:nuclear protein [Mycena metata]|uniref:uS12 prolyl 3,4-dihydroxylase n=1 Tax=Mycena metata TaxID=1033252 RepID=A0AAD7MNG6_9AGAR|nr:nuclear protein [Mycena metata]
MARTHRRDSSPGASDSLTLIKKLKSSHVSSPEGPTNGHVNGVAADPTQRFADGVLDHTSIAQLNAGYASSEPFKYAVVEKLFQDDLLQKVKDECMNELSFTEKETDIYKVNQTGDLASLNYLPSSQISLLPNLLTLRDALYSPVFRNFLRAVTGCGPLSGTKQDMSVNSYTRGCHLLNHDDVIGSRRVSYILYMPLPHFQFWQKDWGGALELYPTIVGPDGEREPVAVPSKSISPSWNQFIFFEVQPGLSFHSVEEVVVGGEGEDGRARLSISGWFHAAQEGEEGYVPEPPTQSKSSREQLTMTSTEFKSYPTEIDAPPEETLSEEHTAFLSEFLNPVYLQPRTMKSLSAQFVEESSLELHSFLSHDLASALEPRLRELDAKDGLGEDRAGRVPPHTSGISEGSVWTVRGPPHKWRYCVLAPHTTGARAQAVTPRAAASCDEIIRGLQDELFSSPAFRAWLAIMSRLLPTRHSVEARRFRPGLDYTLATSEEKEARLDVVLGLTPDVRRDEAEVAEGGRKRTPKSAEVKPRGWQAAEWGGWECYMAPHNEEDDPAVYRAGTIKKTAPETTADSNGASSSKSPNGKANGNGHVSNGHASTEESDVDGDASMEGEPAEEDEDEEEDSTLLTVQPGFNRLLLVLRDERVMRFVKYVSASAEGSRWDVCGEYEVGMMEEEGDGAEDEDP